MERCGSAGPPIIDEFGTMFASRIKGFTVGIRHSLCFWVLWFGAHTDRMGSCTDRVRVDTGRVRCCSVRVGMRFPVKEKKPSWRRRRRPTVSAAGECEGWCRNGVGDGEVTAACEKGELVKRSTAAEEEGGKVEGRGDFGGGGEEKWWRLGCYSAHGGCARSGWEREVGRRGFGGGRVEKEG